MKELFLQSFNDDLEKIGELVADERKQKFDEKKAMKIHDDFWKSLDEKQKEKYRAFEIVLGEETLITEENIYLFALKKGFVMGYELARELK